MPARLVIAALMLVLAGCSLLPPEWHQTRETSCGLDPDLVRSVVGDQTWNEGEPFFPDAPAPGGDGCAIVVQGLGPVTVQVLAFRNGSARRAIVQDELSGRPSRRRSCDEYTERDRPSVGTGCVEGDTATWSAVFRDRFVRIVLDAASLPDVAPALDLDSARRLAEDLDDSLSRR